MRLEVHLEHQALNIIGWVLALVHDISSDKRVPVLQRDARYMDMYI